MSTAPAPATAPLSFNDSGSGDGVISKISLAAVQQLCVDCGFEKNGADPKKCGCRGEQVTAASTGKTDLAVDFSPCRRASCYQLRSIPFAAVRGAAPSPLFLEETMIGSTAFLRLVLLLSSAGCSWEWQSQASEVNGFGDVRQQICSAPSCWLFAKYRGQQGVVGGVTLLLLLLTPTSKSYPRPLPQRADMDSFFKVLGVNALSQFKTKFASTKLEKPTLVRGWRKLLRWWLVLDPSRFQKRSPLPPPAPPSGAAGGSSRS